MRDLAELFVLGFVVAVILLCCPDAPAHAAVSDVPAVGSYWTIIYIVAVALIIGTIEYLILFPRRRELRHITIYASLVVATCGVVIALSVLNRPKDVAAARALPLVGLMSPAECNVYETLRKKFPDIVKPEIERSCFPFGRL